MPSFAERAAAGMTAQMTMAGVMDPGEEICAGDQAPVMVAQKGGWRMTRMRWGFPSRWPGAGLLVNARSETVLSRAAFAESFRERRCLVPASGFLERNGSLHLFREEQGAPLYMAGIYAAFPDAAGIARPAFVILTRPAAGRVLPIHDRMPLLIPEARQDAYFASPETAMGLLTLDPPTLAMVH